MTKYAFLETLDQTIVARIATAETTDSYTARLAAQGLTRVAQKVGEEGVELALAGATDTSDDDMLGEAADLIYHMGVLLAMRKKSLSDVCELLEQRHSEA
ncbi:MAG: phosphoribosyl-ATP diphosphatase [Woeseiaceae bacterium]